MRLVQLLVSWFSDTTRVITTDVARTFFVFDLLFSLRHHTSISISPTRDSRADTRLSMCSSETLS